VTEDAFTVQVTVTDLRVGDVIKRPSGHYYAVDTPPESGARSEEYSEPKVVVCVTEMNDDMVRVGNSATQLHPPEAVLDVLTPRPAE
jgi:hypothetical protein